MIFFIWKIQKIGKIERSDLRGATYTPLASPLYKYIDFRRYEFWQSWSFGLITSDDSNTISSDVLMTMHQHSFHRKNWERRGRGRGGKEREQYLLRWLIMNFFFLKMRINLNRHDSPIHRDNSFIQESLSSNHRTCKMTGEI